MVIGLGRRKESSAKVKLIPGKGELIVNDSISKPYNQQNLFYKSIISKPLESLGLDKNYDIIIHVHGGGINGQIEAARLAVARAVCKINYSFRVPLKSRGFLTRDSRSKERRKYGLKKARKASQFSKR